MMSCSLPSATSRAGGHQQQAVALRRLLHVVRRHQHARPAVGLRADRLPQGGAGQRVDAGRGLIEHQDIGPVREGGDEGQLALQAEGQ